MKNLKKFFYKTILIILILLVIYVTYCSIFNIYKSEIELKPFIIILGIIVMFFFLIRFKKILQKLEENKSNFFAMIICFVFFITLSIFGSVVTSIPTYDLSNLQSEVNLMLSNGGQFVLDGTYFLVYPNQIPTTILIYYICLIGKILNIDNLSIFATIINSMFIAITAFFTYLSIKKLKDYKIALTVLIFLVINPIFYLYASYYYSDTLCMPFASIGIYMFILAIKGKNKKVSIISLIVTGILIAIGFKVRVLIGILLIGMIISLSLSEKLNKKTCMNIGLLVFGFVLGIVLCKLVAIPFDLPSDKEIEFPPTHWVMMGLNTASSGRWNNEDWNYTYNSGGYNQKKQANLEKIANRIEALRIRGWIELTKERLAVNWSNGDYYYIPNLRNVEKINKLYEYIAGNKKIFLLYYLQICKSSILIILSLAIIKEIISDKETKCYNIIYISLFGAFLFYLLWEVSTKYSLTFLPWIMIVCSIGILEIERCLEFKIIRLKIDNRILNFNCENIRRVIAILILINSIFLLIINYYDFTVKENQNWDKCVMQWNLRGNMLENIANNNIQQTFKAFNDFNSISIKFIKKNINKETHYKFKLKNNKGKVLVSQDFTSNDVENEKLKTFFFDKIKPKKNNKYTIEIYSKDATTDNSIGIYTFYQKGYTAYKDGELIINKEVTDADLTFQVANVIDRPYVSKKVYIMLSVLIITIETFAFCPYLKKKK